MDTLAAIFHHLLFLAVFSALLFEHLLFRRSLTVGQARQIQILDIVYGVAALLILVVGALRVFLFEKGASFYFSQPFFWAKIASFVVMGIISIYPTVVFIGWRKRTNKQEAPEIGEKQAKAITLMIRLELTLFVAMVVFAVLMTR